MKSMIILLVCFELMLAYKSEAQQPTQIGIGIGVSFKGFFGLDAGLAFDKNTVYIGYYAIGNKNLLKVVDEILPNYGQTPLPGGETKRLMYATYSYNIRNITVGFGVGIGGEYKFSSFKDQRFNAGGYSIYRSSDLIGDIGVHLGYRINGFLEPYVGYYALQGTQIGIRYFTKR